MGIFAWAFLGGIVGAALMDVTETCAARAGISSGVNIALVGRWFLGLLRGQFAHSNILDSKPFPHEINAGWAFHFLVGGGGVALIYPLFFLATGLPLPGNHLLGWVAVRFGYLCTAVVYLAALVRLGRIGTARAARLECATGEHAFAPALWAWRRCDDRVGELNAAGSIYPR